MERILVCPNPNDPNKEHVWCGYYVRYPTTATHKPTVYNERGETWTFRHFLDSCIIFRSGGRVKKRFRRFFPDIHSRDTFDQGWETTFHQRYTMVFVPGYSQSFMVFARPEFAEPHCEALTTLYGGVDIMPLSQVDIIVEETSFPLHH